MDTAPQSRKSRYYSNPDAGSILPLAMVDSGDQVDNGNTYFYDVYKGMVDQALDRPAQAEITASYNRGGDKVGFAIQVTNHSGVSLSTSNGAQVHAIVYEDADVLETDRIVRSVVSADITNLENGQTETYVLQTPNLIVNDWNELHYVALVDYRPAGATGPYDMLQAAFATIQSSTPSVTINQAAGQPDPSETLPIVFDVNFSRSVTGFTDSDVLVTGTAPGTKTVEVSGVGASYTVSVSGLTGSGTVIASIPAAAAKDEFNNFTAASTSTDNVVTYASPFPKVVAIERADLSPTSAAEVNFLVTFTEDVYEVDASDFSLATTGDLSGAGINSVSGLGSTRMVAVTTGSGSGTLRLDVAADAIIKDLDENLLWDLPYINGEVYHIRTESFADVDFASGFWQWIERLYSAGITGGCSINPLAYCPDKPVKRSEMAIFLERGMRGSAFVPPDASGVIFSDVWPTSFAADWIEQLYADGITSGCGQGAYCPNDPVTRAQMAIFLLRAKYGDDYQPPAEGTYTGFADVAPGDFAAAWIKQLAAEGITAGCGGFNYCPGQAVTRAQMAVFLVRTFELP